MRVLLGLALETKPEAPAFIARCTDSLSSSADTTRAGTGRKALGHDPQQGKTVDLRQHQVHHHEVAIGVGLK